MEALLSTFGIDWRLIVIQAVNFAAVLAVLYFFLFKPLGKMIALRQGKVAKGVADAEAAAQTRAEIDASRAGVLSAAEREAESVVGRAVEEGKGERAEIVKDAQKRSDSLMTDARAQAEELRRKALADSEKDIARMAVLAAEKILKEN